MTKKSKKTQSSSALATRVNLAEAIIALIKDHSNLGIRLVEVPYDWQHDSHNRLAGKFYYITFADGVPTIAEFVEYLYDCLIPYCLPKKLYQPIFENADPAKDFAKIIRLGDEAKGLFISAKNQLDSGGEAGELT